MMVTTSSEFVARVTMIPVQVRVPVVPVGILSPQVEKRKQTKFYRISLQGTMQKNKNYRSPIFSS